MRVFALSDVHVDYAENLAWVQELSSTEFADAALVVAGDVSHRVDRVEATLRVLREKFARVFFVPGNHELWLGRDDPADSMRKHDLMLDLCSHLGVETSPGKVDSVWVVPLLSWYAKPDERDDSLYVQKDGEAPNLDIWGDEYRVRWPELDGQPASRVFLERNRLHVRRYDAPVISFSHVLPRRDLIFELTPAGRVRPEGRRFNFSQVAGTSALDRQVRELGSAVHVHGHQHRNRHRLIDGVVYVSHCLGYTHERQRGLIRNLWRRPKKIWDDEGSFRPEPDVPY